jgi:hypothetical protein
MNMVFGSAGAMLGGELIDKFGMAGMPRLNLWSAEELSEMVGATRPWISVFMQRFRILGLIETSAEQFLIIKEKKLTDYLAQIINSRTRQTNIRPLVQFNLNGERWPSSQDIASSLD